MLPATPDRWTASTREEVISALWYIVAILTYQFVSHWVGWAVALKASLDLMASVILAIAHKE